MRTFLFGFLLSIATNVVTGQSPQHKFIEVFGFGEKEIIADYLEMSVSISETDNLRKDSEFAQKEKMVLDALKNLGIASEDITVDNFNSYRFGLNNSSNRYLLSKTFLIKVRELKSIDDFFIRLYEAGAGHVQVTKRVKTDLEKHKTEAVKAAVENAKQRANEIASSLEIELGKASQVIELKEGEIDPFMDRIDRFYTKQSLSAVGAVHRGYTEPQTENLNVDIRKMNVTYRVAIRFEIISR
ncbi:MAG: DUF541 domain-containing protein [Cyclobacteriaceae bacterium]|nr:MAG: DUF541 domain-containing protein [Cyclobacteriaceae bacterium]